MVRRGAGSRRGYDVRAALRALRALVDDPDDTAQVFRILEAIPGGSAERALSRLRRSDSGARLLCERPRLLAVLADRAALAELPDDSLGRAYLDFVESEGISAEGLVAASEAGSDDRLRDARPADLDYLNDRMRDMHDLWHAVTGYHGDLIGEAALLAFSFAQTWSPGVGVIVALGLYKLSEPGARRVVLGGFRRGLRARWLPGVEWEALLAEPLDDVRRRLGVGPAPRYTPLRTRDFDALAV